MTNRLRLETYKLEPGLYVTGPLDETMLCFADIMRACRDEPYAWWKLEAN